MWGPSVRPRAQGEPSTPYEDSRASIVALDAEYLDTAEFRMQELHNELSQLMVTVKDWYDPTPTISTLRQICAEVDVLGDRMIVDWENFILMKTLPDPSMLRYNLR